MQIRSVRIILTIFFLMILAPLASAQLLIEQGKVKLDISQGTTIADQITVHNTSDATVQVKAYWEDFLYVPPFDGKKRFLPQGATEYSCGHWITFTPHEFTLAPYGKKNIDYTIKVPKDASGGYYGVLFVEQQGGQLEGMAGVKIVARVGTLFFLETTDKKKTARIDQLTIKENATIHGTFSNSGNVILIPAGTYYIVDSEGMIMDRAELPKFYLPPGEKKEFDIQLTKSLKPGKSTAVINFDLEEGNVLIKEIDFEKDAAGNLRILQTRD